jgi:hypothetical protein
MRDSPSVLEAVCDVLQVWLFVDFRSFCAILSLTGSWATGQVAALPGQLLPARKLFIHPTSAEVAGGKASLTISPLSRKAATYTGDYDIKVTPYFFKNETGKLTVFVSDESLLKLIQGMPVEFTGSVTTHGEKKARPINARAIPSGAAHGSVTFSVTAEERKLVFKSKYHFNEE